MSTQFREIHREEIGQQSGEPRARRDLPGHANARPERPSAAQRRRAQRRRPVAVWLVALSLSALVGVAACESGSGPETGKSPRPNQGVAAPSATPTPRPTVSALPAHARPPSPQAQHRAAEFIRRAAPIDVAMSSHGQLMVVYEGAGASGERSAWRLYDRRNRVVATGPYGWEAAPAGDGFIIGLYSRDGFVDEGGGVTPLGLPERQPRTLNKGDIFIPALTAVFRRSDLSLFQGDAGPRAVVSAADGSGRMWALQRRTPGRTVVRFGRPGGHWRSRVLGPAVGAMTVTGERNILMVVGPRRLFLSSDRGATWRLLTHHASPYSGLPGFLVQPDGSILFDDDRGTPSISTDLRSFRLPTDHERAVQLLGDLYRRGRWSHPQVSADGKHWWQFTPANVRQLLAHSSPE